MLPKYVFTLVLENRSFDHMLGWSRITGTDVVSGQRRSVDGVTDGDPAQYSNTYNGTTFAVSDDAPFCMPIGPAHDFPDVFEQLVGEGAQYTPGSAYPARQNSGFVANYAAQMQIHPGTNAQPGDVMRCFDTATQLPVLYALASQFVVCDKWFSSMPGPTWPNRFFVHAASSGGLDHSPSTLDMGGGYTFEPFRFQHGQIFAYLEEQNLPWYVLSSYWLPQCFAMEGMRGYWHQPELHFIDSFAALLDELATQQSGGYVFIEPNYGHIVTDTYRCGTSQHAVDDVTRGEWLLKCVYEKLRASLLWNECALIVTWDEHGGFYDHVPPPDAVPPGDGVTNRCNSKYQFNFDSYGVRVPALLISPLTEGNLVDGRIHDHATVLSTLETIMHLGSFTLRDAREMQPPASLATLFTRDTPRDCPMTLPNPVASGDLAECDALHSTDDVINLPVFDALDQDPGDAAPQESLPAFAHIAHLLDVSVTDPNEDHDPKQAFESAMHKAADVRSFLGAVQQRLRDRSPKLKN